MIGRLRGKVEYLSKEQILLDVQGVGYLVNVPASTREKLPSSGGEISLLIHTQVREDAIVLYGFATQLEKDIFEQIITVSGIGPKVALAVLSTLKPDAFSRAIRDGSVHQLTRVPGIGKRTAERLVVELKDKVAKMFPVAEGRRSAGREETVAAGISEALAALLALGYSEVEAKGALAQLSLDGSESTETVIRQALRYLA